MDKVKQLSKNFTMGTENVLNIIITNYSSV